MNAPSTISIVLSLAALGAAIAALVTVSRTRAELERARAEFRKPVESASHPEGVAPSAARQIEDLRAELSRLKALLAEAKAAAGSAPPTGVTRADLLKVLDDYYAQQRRETRVREARDLEDKLGKSLSAWISKVTTEVGLDEAQILRIREACEDQKKQSLEALRETDDRNALAMSWAINNVLAIRQVRGVLKPEQAEKLFKDDTPVKPGWWHGGLLGK